MAVWSDLLYGSHTDIHRLPAVRCCLLWQFDLGGWWRGQLYTGQGGDRHRHTLPTCCLMLPSLAVWPGRLVAGAALYWPDWGQTRTYTAYLLSDAAFSGSLAWEAGGGGSSILARVANMACSMADWGLAGLLASGTGDFSTLASPEPLENMGSTRYISNMKSHFSY